LPAYNPNQTNAQPPPPTDLTKPVALRIVGSNVKNQKGEYLGRIENVTINPESKQVEYALLDMNYPTNSSHVTPVPWQMLNYVWDQGQVGGLPGAVQMFRLDVDKARLAQAPTVEKTQLAFLQRPEFRQQLFAFYGNGVDYAMGATGNAGTVASGAAVGAAGAMPAAGSTSGATDAGFFDPGVLVVPVDTNTVASTNLATTTNSATGATQTNLFPGTSNPFPGGTNIFPGGTNISPGTNVFTGTNIFPGGTNIFPGARATPQGVSGAQATPAQQSGTTTTTPAATPPAGRGSTWTPATRATVPVTPSTSTPGTSGQNSSGTSVAPTVAPTLPPVPSPTAPVTPTMPPASTPRTGVVAPRSTR
jgi:hypothetical protein